LNNIIKGDTLTLSYSLADYSSQTYDIWVALRGASAVDIKTGTSGVTVTKSGGNFSIVVTAATTAGWTAGKYSYAVYAGKSSWAERYIVYSGRVTVVENIATQVAGYDGRSHAQKALDAIEAVLENRASRDQSQYSIAGRQITKMTIDELLKFRNYYRSEVEAERLAERAANGDNPGYMVKVKF